MRFVEFLRTAVLLFGGAATALAAVAIAGATSRDDTTLIFVAPAWWAIAAVIGAWLGRSARVAPGIGRLLSSARTTPALPELEPGAIFFNRLWTLFVFTIVAGALAFWLPQVPAVGAGYALVMALAWRKQSAAVAAIEDRDGVRFYIDRTSPLHPTRLIRTPGFRRFEPAPEAREPRRAQVRSFAARRAPARSARWPRSLR